MILDRATVDSNHQRFIKRVVEQELVYALSSSEGIAISTSNDEEELDVLMFWSDKAYALRSKNKLGESFSLQEVELFDFLYRWLPGMSGDKVLAGTNWNADLIGTEIDPFQLREEIEEKMNKELLDKYEKKYVELTTNT